VKRKLKPDAIPMEFVEEAQIIVENDLGIYIYVALFIDLLLKSTVCSI